MADEVLPKLDCPIPELTEHERMFAAARRFHDASSVRSLPATTRATLASLGMSLRLAAESHETEPCENPDCGALALADTLLGREVRRG